MIKVTLYVVRTLVHMDCFPLKLCKKEEKKKRNDILLGYFLLALSYNLCNTS